MSAADSEALLSWLGQFGLFILGGLLLAVGVLAWTGVWRSWATSPRVMMTSTKRNVVPFTMGLLGIALVCFGLALSISAGVLPGSAMAANISGGVFAVLAWVSTLWWPAALAPGWYKDWVRRGGNGRTNPVPSVKNRMKGHR